MGTTPSHPDRIGPIESEAGGGHLDASDSGVLMDLCSCVGTILGQTKTMLPPHMAVYI